MLYKIFSFTTPFLAPPLAWQNQTFSNWIFSYGWLWYCCKVSHFCAPPLPSKKKKALKVNKDKIFWFSGTFFYGHPIIIFIIYTCYSLLDAVSFQKTEPLYFSKHSFVVKSSAVGQQALQIILDLTGWF